MHQILVSYTKRRAGCRFDRPLADPIWAEDHSQRPVIASVSEGPHVPSDRPMNCLIPLMRQQIGTNSGKGPNSRSRVVQAPPRGHVRAVNHARLCEICDQNVCVITCDFEVHQHSINSVIGASPDIIWAMGADQLLRLAWYPDRQCTYSQCPFSPRHRPSLRRWPAPNIAIRCPVPPLFLVTPWRPAPLVSSVLPPPPMWLRSSIILCCFHSACHSHRCLSCPPPAWASRIGDACSHCAIEADAAVAMALVGRDMGDSEDQGDTRGRM